MTRSNGTEGTTPRLHRAVVIGFGALVALGLAFWNQASVLDDDLRAFSKPIFAFAGSSPELQRWTGDKTPAE